MLGKPGKVGDPTDIYETPEDEGPIVADGGDMGRASLHSWAPDQFAAAPRTEGLILHPLGPAEWRNKAVERIPAAGLGGML